MLNWARTAAWWNNSISIPPIYKPVAKGGPDYCAEYILTPCRLCFCPGYWRALISVSHRILSATDFTYSVCSQKSYL